MDVKQDLKQKAAVMVPFAERMMFPSKMFKKICVFCGSSSGKKGVFTNEALNLGRELVNRKIDLVYGGGSIGLMGQVAQTVQSGGGHVVGVIPKALIGKELTGSTVGELIAVTDMHQRKAEMARQADAFIALPGGYGTLEELVEVITWNQLGIHRKPVGLLNVDGFYDTLLTFFDKQLEEEFFDNSARSIVVSAPTAVELLDKMEAHTPTLIEEHLKEDRTAIQVQANTVFDTAQYPCACNCDIFFITGACSLQSTEWRFFLHDRQMEQTSDLTVDDSFDLEMREQVTLAKLSIWELLYVAKFSIQLVCSHVAWLYYYNFFLYSKSFELQLVYRKRSFLSVSLYLVSITESVHGDFILFSTRGSL